MLQTPETWLLVVSAASTVASIAVAGLEVIRQPGVDASPVTIDGPIIAVIVTALIAGIAWMGREFLGFLKAERQRAHESQMAFIDFLQTRTQEATKEREEFRSVLERHTDISKEIHQQLVEIGRHIGQGVQVQGGISVSSFSRCPVLKGETPPDGCPVPIRSGLRA